MLFFILKMFVVKNHLKVYFYLILSIKKLVELTHSVKIIMIGLLLRQESIMMNILILMEKKENLQQDKDLN